MILKNGKEIARLISHESAVSFLADSLNGVLRDSKSSKIPALKPTEFLERL